MDVGIRMPVLERKPGNLMETKDPLSCGANTFLAGSLVKRDASNLLAACVSADTSCYGWSPGPSTAAGSRRPDAFWDPQSNAGGGPYAYNLEGADIILNITDGSGNVGEANSAPQLNDVTIGNSYNLYRWTSGTYQGMQALNVDGTGSTLLTVVGKVNAQDPGFPADGSAYNGLVRCRIAAAKLML